MNWVTISTIATAVSAIVGCASLWSAFYLYQIEKRREKSRSFRDALVAARTLARQLDSLLTYEMGYEIAHCVISWSPIQIFLRKVHTEFFSANMAKTKEELDTYLKANTPVIVSPIHSPTVDQFEDKLALLQQEEAAIAFDHPGVGRIVVAAVHVLQNTFRGQKGLVHDEDAWSAALRQVFEKKKPGDGDFEYFATRLTLMFVGTWMDIMKQVNQPNIDDTISALELVVDRYLQKTARELNAASRSERSKQMIPDSKTKTIGDDLREAEKCLGRVLVTEDILLLRQYSAQMEARSHKAEHKS